MNNCILVTAFIRAVCRFHFEAPIRRGRQPQGSTDWVYTTSRPIHFPFDPVFSAWWFRAVSSASPCPYEELTRSSLAALLVGFPLLVYCLFATSAASHSTYGIHRLIVCGYLTSPRDS